MKIKNGFSILAAALIILSLAGCFGGAGEYSLQKQPADNLNPLWNNAIPPVREQEHLGPTPGDDEALALEIVASPFKPGIETEPMSLPRPVNNRLAVTVEEAVFLALSNNRSLGVQLFSPLIAGTFEEQERAVFDPAVFAEASLSRDDSETTSGTTGIRGESETYRIGIGQTLPTGTGVGVALLQSRSDSTLARERQAAGLEVTLTQALLRGAGLENNLARIRQAELDTMVSLFELRGFTEALVAEVEAAYWEFVLAQQRVLIYEEALLVARRQADHIERRIEVGSIAETELAAAQAELASRLQGLINAKNSRDRARLGLLRLLNPDVADGWSLELATRDQPHGPEGELDSVIDHVSLGLRMRPELAEARLRVERGRLDVVQTRNGILPRLDLFVTLGKTGYADSFGGSLSDISGPHYDATAGMRFEWTLGNRAAEAVDKRARANRAQAMASLDNLAQLVVMDIREAYLEVERARAQIEASAVRRRLQEEVLRAEQVKFDVGRGTALTVAQAQRDLLESQLDEINTIVGYRLARLNLYRLDGSLLSRRGIEIAGKHMRNLP